MGLYAVGLTSQPNTRPMTTATATKTYHGYANWETWNVALWLQNDEALYLKAKSCKGSYAALCMLLDKEGQSSYQIFKDGWGHTPDGVCWGSLMVDSERICRLMADL